MVARATRGASRLLPAALVVAAVVVLLASVVSGGCGEGEGGGTAPTAGATATVPPPSPSPSASPAATATPAATTTIFLYFLRRGELGVAERRVPATTMPATAAVRALLAGPDEEERAAGLAPAVTAGVALRRLAIADGVAEVDLSAPPDPDPTAPPARLRGTAALVYTLTRFATVDAVALTVAGEPYPASLPGPLTRRPFRALEPEIFVEQPGVGALLPDPFVLAGSARVFEATFTAQLSGPNGRRIATVTVTAGRGAPARGRFRTEVAYSARPGPATLLVYDVSMADGSRQHLVRIPVVLAP